MERLKLLPLSQDSVEERVAAFRNFSDEVMMSSWIKIETLWFRDARHIWSSSSVGASQPVRGAACLHEHPVHAVQASEGGASWHTRTSPEDVRRQRHGEVASCLGSTSVTFYLQLHNVILLIFCWLWVIVKKKKKTQNLRTLHKSNPKFFSRWK